MIRFLTNIFITSLKLGGDTDVSLSRSSSGKSNMVRSLWNGVDNLTNYGYNGSA